MNAAAKWVTRRRQAAMQRAKKKKIVAAKEEEVDGKEEAEKAEQEVIWCARVAEVRKFEALLQMSARCKSNKSNKRFLGVIERKRERATMEETSIARSNELRTTPDEQTDDMLLGNGTSGMMAYKHTHTHTPRSTS